MSFMADETIFGLIRHAETEWNREKRIQGQQDAPLTSQGRLCSQLWGQQLNPYRWDFILASDLGRAQETARLMNDQLQIPSQAEAGLREQHWGEWTAKTLGELKTRQADRLAVLEAAGWEFAPPGGESRREVLLRSRETLLSAAKSRPGQRVLVVCHEGVVKCLLYHLCGRKFMPSEGRLLKPRHLHLITAKGKTLELNQINALELMVPA